jgi:hypothetical protein
VVRAVSSHRKNVRSAAKNCCAAFQGFPGKATGDVLWTINPLDSGMRIEIARHRTLTAFGLWRTMILMAFTLSLCAAAALIVGLGAVVSVEAPAHPAARGDAGLI